MKGDEEKIAELRAKISQIREANKKGQKAIEWYKKAVGR